MPERFPRYGKEPWYSRGLRFASIDNYIVFYIPDIEEQTVTILRVMYSGRNMEEQLSIHTKQSTISYSIQSGYSFGDQPLFV